MKKHQTTIIYYTSNREDPGFEAKIRANILKHKGDLPIISISQKPIDFGKNICVGEVGHSYLNAWRQMLIGAKTAETDYVIFTEADFLYPKEYFTFQPQGDDIYRYDNVWIAFTWKYHCYFRKFYSEGAQICKREYLIKTMEEYLEEQPEWFDGRIEMRDKRGRRKGGPFGTPADSFSSNIPCVSFKTGKGIRKLTNVLPGRENRARRLSYWGHIVDLEKEYLNA